MADTNIQHALSTQEGSKLCSIASFCGTFFVGVFLALGAISAIPPAPDTVRYGLLQGTMSRVSDVHERITKSSTPIDVAFIGSSHTWNSVADSELQRQLDLLGTKVSVANLASSWFGRDLHLFILRQLLENKTPRLVVIEITDHEVASGHDVLPYVGRLSDLVCCTPFIDPRFPAHFALYLKKVILDRVWLIRNPESGFHEKPYSDFGWMAVDKTWDTPKPNDRPMTLKQRAKYIFYRLTGLYGLTTVEKMVKLANERGAKVAFLYLPEHEFALMNPANEIGNFTRLGPVIRLPDTIGRDASLWFDKAHLNEDGAIALTAKLTKEVHALLNTN